MKKLLFILCVSFLIGNAFAAETESDVIEESVKLELADNFNLAMVTRCCRRTVRNAEGESWTARRCATHEDAHIAMGRACEMAAADAQNAMERAVSYILLKVD